MRFLLLLGLLLVASPAWGEVDFVPERLPAALELGRWGPGYVRVTNRGPAAWPPPGSGAPLVGWEIAESADGPPVYLDYAPMGAPLAPGESRLVGLHLGGAVRPGKAWLRVRPVLVGNDWPGGSGVLGTAELPVVMPADASFWTRWQVVTLDALWWGWWSALLLLTGFSLRRGGRGRRSG